MTCNDVGKDAAIGQLCMVVSIFHLDPSVIGVVMPDCLFEQGRNRNRRSNLCGVWCRLKPLMSKEGHSSRVRREHIRG